MVLELLKYYSPYAFHLYYSPYAFHLISAKLLKDTTYHGGIKSIACLSNQPSV